MNEEELRRALEERAIEREEKLKQTIDELNYRLTNVHKKIESLESGFKQAREEIEILEKLIESEK